MVLFEYKYYLINFFGCMFVIVFFNSFTKWRAFALLQSYFNVDSNDLNACHKKSTILKIYI